MTAYVKMVVRSTRTCVCVCVLVHVNACVFISLCNGEDIQDAIVCVGVCVRERGSGGRDTGQRQRETRRHGACACVCVSVIGEEKTAVSLSSLVSLQRPVLGCKQACQAVSVTTCHTERTHTRTRAHTRRRTNTHAHATTNFP